MKIYFPFNNQAKQGFGFANQNIKIVVVGSRNEF